MSHHSLSTVPLILPPLYHPSSSSPSSTDSGISFEQFCSQPSPVFPSRRSSLNDHIAVKLDQQIDSVIDFYTQKALPEVPETTLHVGCTTCPASPIPTRHMPPGSQLDEMTASVVDVDDLIHPGERLWTPDPTHEPRLRPLHEIGSWAPGLARSRSRAHTPQDLTWNPSTTPAILRSFQSTFVTEEESSPSLPLLPLLSRASSTTFHDLSVAHYHALLHEIGKSTSVQTNMSNGPSMLHSLSPDSGSQNDDYHHILHEISTTLSQATTQECPPYTPSRSSSSFTTQKSRPTLPYTTSSPSHRTCRDDNPAFDHDMLVPKNHPWIYKSRSSLCISNSSRLPLPSSVRDSSGNCRGLRQINRHPSTPNSNLAISHDPRHRQKQGAHQKTKASLVFGAPLANQRIYTVSEAAGESLSLLKRDIVRRLRGAMSSV